jgi:glycosyltransferase involved in cell wall biosynthesis
MDATNGDFIERQAKAVSRSINTIVLFVDKDSSLPSGKVEIEQSGNGNLVVYKAYYGSSEKKGMLSQLQSMSIYRSVQWKLYKQIVQEHGRPKLVHVQVAMKAGLLALKLKKKQQLPYVITEHWTGYYPASNPSVYEKNLVWKFLNRKILKNARLFFPVSEDLGTIVNKHLVRVPFVAIPNVVDTRLFYYTAFQPPVFRFVHASYLNYQKNAEGMIIAAAELAARGSRFELILIGNKKTSLEELASRHGLLNKYVFIKPAVPYEEVATAMQQASALIMFSRFENLPCVVLEGLCCGLPVISSRVGGIPEIVNQSNGLLVESKDISSLAHAMQQMMDNYEKFDRAQIAKQAKEKFSYETVGKQYIENYSRIIRM